MKTNIKYRALATIAILVYSTKQLNIVHEGSSSASGVIKQNAGW